MARYYCSLCKKFTTFLLHRRVDKIICSGCLDARLLQGELSCPNLSPEPNNAEEEIPLEEAQTIFGLDKFDIEQGQSFYQSTPASFQPSTSAGLVSAGHHNRKLPFKCATCNKHFATEENLEIHQHLHTGGLPYSCNLCHKSFSRKERLNTHRCTHTGKRRYLRTQSDCDKIFYNKVDLNKHRLRQH
jgi:uncharacterized Zn-finger protein